jgi:glycosyltransferase involved in cell wall biosynthesis
MRHVDINGRFLTQPITGVQRYATELVRALDRTLAVDPIRRNRYRFRLLTPRQELRPLPLEHVSIASVGRLRGHAWEQLELPIHSGSRLLLNLGNTAPLSVRAVVTIYDASVFAVPRTYSRAFRLWYQTLIPLLGRRALRVLTISGFSQSELSRYAGIPREKLSVIGAGAEHILRTSADHGVLQRLGVTPGRYILGVGSRSSHKNIEAVVAAVSRLGAGRLPLVMVGGTNARVFSNTDGPSDPCIKPAGYLTDSELRCLYEQATCFVYPSLYEGFGLPPLEAMSCGCPTIVSRVASLPEVCGDAVLYCNPTDPDDIARHIRALIQSPEKRDDLRHRGLERAQSFTWNRASTALFDILDDLQAA